MKTRSMLVVSIAAFALGVALADTGCNAAFNPCGGQQECSDGTCAPVNSVCCGNGTSCPQGTVCGAGNTCLSGTVGTGVSSCEGCLSVGEECCLNLDETVDCAPVGSVCCGNHSHCQAGNVCCVAGCCI